MNNLVTEQQHFFSKPLSIFTKDSDTSLSSFDEKEDSMLQFNEENQMKNSQISMITTPNIVLHSLDSIPQLVYSAKKSNNKDDWKKKFFWL